ncbi:hypothetical protein BaRGS_00022073 [Batillaria attramentaria]|uniref:Uncharacterized protein n=1 Tax=Batillaria attramentaria TaxID=370345 RepID=A0ABD0KI20_9CAEN
MLQKYGFLLKRDSFAGWTTFTCLNCKKKTHAINRELKTILVNKELECGDDALARLVGSKEFSPVFQIVLADREVFSSVPDPNAQSFESLQTQLSDVQHQMESFLLRQEAAMEERIRRFEEEQREKLAHLQAKAQEDKKKMISLILRRVEQPGPTGRAAKPRTPLTKSKSVLDDSATPRSQASQPISIGRVRSPARNLEPDIERDELFPIDGFDEDADSYGHSSSEEDDDVPAVTMGRREVTPKQELVYSASVPVNVPMGAWGNETRSDNMPDFDSDDENHPLDPDQIASNMAALAESIPDNNRYIFGDRPRPRLNTNNF